MVKMLNTPFHLKGFARRLVLKQKQKVSLKWPISLAAVPVEKEHLLRFLQIVWVCSRFGKRFHGNTHLYSVTLV